jgi:hypothetical protein
MMYLKKEHECYIHKNNEQNEEDLPKLKESSVGDKSGRNIPDMSIDKSWLCSVISIVICK